MALEINGSVETYQNNSTNQTNSKRKIPETVTTTIRKNETPFSDEHFSLMQAAKKAGLPPSEQRKFADANADGIMYWGENSDPSPNDDKVVKQADYAKLDGKTSVYKLSAEQIADLRQRVADYVTRGGKLYTNKEVPTSLSSRVNEKNGITPPLIGDPNAIGTNPLGETPKTHFSVTLNNNGKKITNERILSQFAEDRYGGGNLWGENFQEIGRMSDLQGVKANNVVIKPMGNKVVVYFEVSPQDQLKIHENYKIVQEKVNAIEEITKSVTDKMALNQFLKGVFEGAWDSLKENWKMLTNPIETAKGIIEAVKTLASLSQEDLVKIVEHLKQSGHDLIFKDDVSEVANKAGRLVGTLAVEIALGKGIGVALRGLKGIKAIESLVGKADDLAKAGKAKILETFSDDAAKIASERARRRLATQLYGGIPADVLADMAIVAGNKLKNGAVRFADFAKQMVDEFGEKVKPHLEKLYREKMTDLGLTNNIDEFGIKAQKYVRPEAGTPEHKKLRWSEYEANNANNPKKLSYETWSKIYDVNMQQARKSNIAVKAYRDKIGWGKIEVTVDVSPNVSRRLDIADVKAKKAIEHKTGYISLDEDIRWELERDKQLVKQGWNITWHFEGTASKPLIEALKKAGIKITYK